MHSYAQTNAQLFNQLRSEGYSKEERERVRQAYEFGMRLFTGLFLPSGKPFIDHLVGTASILASLHVSVEIVTAGLIHAAYLHGDFGGIRQGISEAKRKQVKDVVGEEVEEYVVRYDRTLLNWETIAVLRDTLAELGSVDRDVLLMRLVNELEHNLDLGGLYYARCEKEQKGLQRHMERYGPIMVHMAEKLGFPSLSVEMEATFKSITSAELPLEPCVRTNEQVAYLVVARSYRVRFWIIWSRKGHRLFSTILDRARRLYWKIPEPISGWLRTVFQLSGIKVK
jgi:(p)ppGpp synthase/HD superfamily hydrolase